jgi:hypothetical protein
MSGTLMWESTERKSKSLPYALRRVLQKNLLCDASRVTLSKLDIPYLEGLEDADIDGAGELIEAIENHNEVDIWVSY